MEKMTKVRDFADSCGCTPQNIYLHLKNYAQELEGHTVKGRRGILLDDFACDFIRSVMYPKEVSADTELMEELNRARAALVKAAQENAQLKADLFTTEGERDKAREDLDSIKLALEDSKLNESKLEEAVKNITETAEAFRDKALEAEHKNELLMKRGLLQRLLNKPV